ncbi:hypothetical protein [Aquimarina intermedia]|uniref:Anti-sigma factor n=1 Tax=Aquimarina intermedia TaxID=350814 RepID=A0A5S5CB16_9FLAO|nr:hypothetical protein [Aquimarina intermedia]TYP75173.1 hypothetical protein BD809_103237 [Aquimarina intermedia]
MKQDKLEDFFEKIRDNVDIYEPSDTHFENFSRRLSAIPGATLKQDKNNTINWFKPLSIAAAIALLLISSLFIFQNRDESKRELASVSDEMYTTQSFFASTIAFKLKEIKKTATIADKELVNDAMNQLDKLDIDYQKLKQDLVISNNDTRVISAMIENFQQRATLLENVLETLQQNKLNKNYSNENNIL